MSKTNPTIKFSNATVKGFLGIAEMLNSNDIKQFKNRKYYSIKMSDMEKHLTPRSVEILLDLKTDHR